MFCTADADGMLSNTRYVSAHVQVHIAGLQCPAQPWHILYTYIYQPGLGHGSAMLRGGSPGYQISSKSGATKKWLKLLLLNSVNGGRCVEAAAAWMVGGATSTDQCSPSPHLRIVRTHGTKADSTAPFVILECTTNWLRQAAEYVGRHLPRADLAAQFPMSQAWLTRLSDWRGLL